jgi:hypothetical protein
VKCVFVVDHCQMTPIARRYMDIICTAEH